MSSNTNSPFCVYCGNLVVTSVEYNQCNSCAALVCADCRRVRGEACPNCSGKFVRQKAGEGNPSPKPNQNHQTDNSSGGSSSSSGTPAWQSNSIWTNKNMGPRIITCVMFAALIISVIYVYSYFSHPSHL